MAQIEFQNKEGQKVEAVLYSLISSQDITMGTMGMISKSDYRNQEKYWKREFPFILKQYQHIQELREIKSERYPNIIPKSKKLEESDGRKYTQEILEQIIKLEPLEIAEIITIKAQEHRYSLEKDLFKVYGRICPLITYAGFGTTLVNLIVRENGDNFSDDGTKREWYEYLPIKSIMKYCVIDKDKKS